MSASTTPTEFDAAMGIAMINTGAADTYFFDCGVTDAGRLLKQATAIIDSGKTRALQNEVIARVRGALALLEGGRR